MSRPYWKAMARGGLNAALFVGLFAGVALAVHACLPLPDPPEIHPKLVYLREHIDEFDTLFIGTSRIYRHIIPSEFDELTARAGMPTHSFNAGVDGMRPPEDGYFLDQILRFHPTRLRWVFVESCNLRATVDTLKRGTSRNVYWHDWERLKLLFQETMNVKPSRHLRNTLLSLREPIGLFSEHLGLFAENMSNLGQGATHLNAFLDPQTQHADGEALGPKKDGFREVDYQHMDEKKERPVYEEAILDRADDPVRVDFAGAPSQEALRYILRKIAEFHATPVLVIAPTTASRVFYPEPGADGAAPLLFDYSDFWKYPDLFLEENRLDTDHLNTAGAKIFTRLLAEDFTRAVQDGPAKKDSPP